MKTKQKHNIICVGHRHTQDEDKKTKKTQRNMCWTPLYTNKHK